MSSSFDIPAFTPQALPASTPAFAPQTLPASTPAFAPQTLPPAAAAATPNFSDRDTELWHRWNNAEEGTKVKAKAKSMLINNMSNLLYTQVKQQQGSLPTSALMMEAAHWADHAINTFNPDMGNKLSTHVFNWVRKTSRTNTKHQNNNRMSEKKQGLYKHWVQAQTMLADELNREPTEQELATRLNMTVKQVKDYQKELVSDLFESGSDVVDEASGFDWGTVKLNYVKDNLTDREKEIFDDRANNVPVSDTMKRLGINQNAYNYERRKLTSKVSELLERVSNIDK